MRTIGGRVRGGKLLFAINIMMNAAVANVGPALAQVAAEEIKHYDLRVESGRLADGPKTIQVKRGDTVELVWSADRPTAIHLHGYDIEITAAPSRPQTMSFKARATGRFPIEIHGGGGSERGRHAVLIYLEVHPR